MATSSNVNVLPSPAKPLGPVEKPPRFGFEIKSAYFQYIEPEPAKKTLQCVILTRMSFHLKKTKTLDTARISLRISVSSPCKQGDPVLELCGRFPQFDEKVITDKSEVSRKTTVSPNLQGWGVGVSGFGREVDETKQELQYITFNHSHPTGACAVCEDKCEILEWEFRGNPGVNPFPSVQVLLLINIHSAGNYNGWPFCLNIEPNLEISTFKVGGFAFPAIFKPAVAAPLQGWKYQIRGHHNPEEAKKILNEAVDGLSAQLGLPKEGLK